MSKFKILKATMSVFLIMSVGFLYGCGGGGGGTPKKPEAKTNQVIECRYTTENAPMLDGVADDAIWQNIQPVNILLESYYTFDMKTAYDDENIYFLFEWVDADSGEMKSIGEWVLENGKWNWRLISDAFSIMWDIYDIKDFNTTGCTPLCHDQPEDLNKRYMGPENLGEYEELWWWNPAISGTKGIAATYFINALPEGVSIEDPNFDNKITWQELPGEYGFKRNKAEDSFGPAEQIAGDKAPLYLLYDTPASGDAAIVKAQGKWDSGKWTLELSRPRNPANKDMLKFEVSNNGWSDYLFSTAIHYNDERENHKTMQEGATLRMVGKEVKE